MFVSDVAYDNFMGRYSTKLAVGFADFAGVTEGQRVLDVGAGTGALTAELVKRGADVAAADPSPPFVATLRTRFPGIDAREAGAEHMPWPDESFDAALAQLVVTFMDDAPAGIAEMRRLVKPGGVVAACMWDRQGMDLLAAVARTQERYGSGAPTTEARNLYRTRGELETLLGPNLETELLEVTAGYSGFDEFADAVKGGVGPAGAWLLSLPEAERDAALEDLHRQVGAPTGPFELTGRAWAVRTTRE
jgi:SAM-dependent methyltransferase